MIENLCWSNEESLKYSLEKKTRNTVPVYEHCFFSTVPLDMQNTAAKVRTSRQNNAATSLSL
jgi:hypothetical protein